MFDTRERGLRLHAAAAIAREAGEIAQRRFADRASFTVGLKGPQDFLTEVDGEVERFVATRLHALFPGDGFIGEEGEGRQARDGAPTWVVDPIDGTANFARGIPHFCVSIALTLEGHSEAGVIFDPVKDELFAAGRGGGAFLNGAPIKVSTTPDMRAAAIEVGWNMRSGPETFLGITTRVVGQGAAVMRCGSGALALAYVAAGRTDAFIEHHINAWDCLAGNALVTEAGGHVSDFLARDGLHKGNALLACTPALREALAAIAAAEGVIL
ncbi:MAG: inositol monophosphatase [Pseudomonadota bacterium]|nr:inositol monophosphatase [Pseudomonadota bacterium]